MPSITTSLLLPGRWLLPSINSSHPTSTSRSTDRCTDSPHQVLRQSILDRLASLPLPMCEFALGNRPSAAPRSACCPPKRTSYLLSFAKVRATEICFLCFAEIQGRSEEHTSELQSLMRISYAVFCLKKKKKQK